jgi:2-haloacid dehalogenase
VPIRALVFDVFGTLLDWRTEVASALERAAIPGDPGDLANEWRRRWLALTGEVLKRQREWQSFDGLGEVSLDALLAEHAADVDQDGRGELLAAWRRLDPWPDVRDGLETLHADRITAALSNGNTSLLVALARHGKLRFDGLLSAELVKTYKPAREVYELAPRLLGLAADEVMLVAAHPFDLEGARGAGLRSAFVDRPLEYGPDSPPREDPEADFSVSDLHELAGELARGR